MVTFSGGRWIDSLFAYSCAPCSPRVMSHLADLAASSSSCPGGQVSVSTSDRNTDVLGPSASYTKHSGWVRRLMSSLNVEGVILSPFCILAMAA